MKNTEKDLWYATPTHIPLLGHRGNRAQYPENTLVSFASAIDMGVDLIEFDVNLTKDEELVVIHDNSIDRTSDHTGLTRDYTLQELKSFDFGSWFGEKFRGTQIPTLREVLDLVKAKSDTLLLNVEIKDMTHQAVDLTIAMLQEYHLEERCVIACFDAEIIRYTKETYPQFRTQGFHGRYMSHFTESTYDCMFGMGIPLNENAAEDVAFAQSRGILAWLYPADTPEQVKECVRYGADNITSNDPQMALDTLRECMSE